jgi:uncharacterized YccA/Bax inhibitor family protein
MLRTSNPALQENTFLGYRRIAGTEQMTVQGVVFKTIICLLLLMLTAGWTWIKFAELGNAQATTPWMVIGMVGGLILGIATVFKKEWSPITAPLYALAEGLFIGGISAMFEASYPGLVFQAVGLTFGTTLAMLFAYQSGFIRPSEKFKLGVVAATGGIAVVYLVGLVFSLFGINFSFLYGSGLFSILFSVFVVVVAALNLILDFDFIEQGAEQGAPKFMEWYGSFALMVTLIWLYIEFLRLLAKMRER